MRINSVQIRNLKSFHKIDLLFHEHVNLIYGQNGMGKTTVLEAVSLLGHLATMRRIEIISAKKVEMKESLLLESLKSNEIVSADDNSLNTQFDFSNTGQLHAERFEDLRGEIEENYRGRKNDLNEWFDQRKSVTNEALIRYDITLDKETADEPTIFYIWFISHDDLSITKTLGRKVFDDKDMNDFYALIWEKDGNTQDDSKMARLLEHLLKSTKFLITTPPGISKYTNDLHTSIKQEIVSGTGSWDKVKAIIGRAIVDIVSDDSLNSDRKKLFKHTAHDGYIKSIEGVVSESKNVGFSFYLNTDLNDFGRGRDVRESVKDIFGDFIAEWIDRLGIKFIPKIKSSSMQGSQVFEFSNRLELQRILNYVLNPPLFYTLWLFVSKVFGISTGKQNDYFHLDSCSVTHNNGRYEKPEIRIKRPTDKKSVKLDYLSAGENECFFIFLYLLGVNVNNSICLFDEPDLHLSQFSKRPFYTALYELLGRSGCQTIISTHSGFAYTNPEIIKRFHIRRSGKEHKTNYTRLFGLKLAWQYYRTASAILGGAIAIYFIQVAALFALGSDVINATNQQGLVKHGEVLQLIVYVLAYALAAIMFTRCIKYASRLLQLIK